MDANPNAKDPLPMQKSRTPPIQAPPLKIQAIPKAKILQRMEKVHPTKKAKQSQSQKMLENISKFSLSIILFKV